MGESEGSQEKGSAQQSGNQDETCSGGQSEMGRGQGGGEDEVVRFWTTGELDD